MTLEYAFNKAKLPRGLSFPLKRSVLDAALLEAGVLGIDFVYYWLRQRGHLVMWADYRGEGRRGWASAGQLSITVYAVPSAERQATEEALVAEVLPRLVGWLKSLEKSGNTRRGSDQHFVASWEAGDTTIGMS